MAPRSKYLRLENAKAREGLESLKSGKSIFHPITNQKIISKEFIFFESAFGKNHPDTGKHIDLMIFLDTPLDTCMARRLLRDYPEKEDFKNLKHELEVYLVRARGAYLSMDYKVRPYCDFIVDGDQAIEELVARFLEKLDEK